MFTLFRYGLIPVVLFCLVVVAASFDTYATNAARASTWPQTVATVIHAQDAGDVLARFRGTENTFPDPFGKLKYVVDRKTYEWEGRGREIGVTVMNPGDKINIHYDPENPRDISTLVLLGAFTGNIILATALAFLAFYVWFFWFRGFLRRSGASPEAVWERGRPARSSSRADVTGTLHFTTKCSPTALIRRLRKKS